MSNGFTAIRSGAAQGCRPWERHLLDLGQWRALVVALRDDRALELLALWADPAQVHAAFHQPGQGLLLASLPVQEGRYPALSPVRPTWRRFPPARHAIPACRRSRNSCPWKAKACIRSRSGRCMPASLNPGISASTSRAKPWCGWNSGWATPTRAISA